MNNNSPSPLSLSLTPIPRLRVSSFLFSSPRTPAKTWGCRWPWVGPRDLRGSWRRSADAKSWPASGSWDAASPPDPTDEWGSPRTSTSPRPASWNDPSCGCGERRGEGAWLRRWTRNEDGSKRGESECTALRIRMHWSFDNEKKSAQNQRKI